jgi:DNA-binding CsgD family transcriptional regulator
VALTADPLRRAERILAAAMASMQAGAFGKALELLVTVDAGPLDDFQHARVDLMRGTIAFASGFGSDGPPLLLKAARRLEPFDLELARETYLTAWRAAVNRGHSAGGEVLPEICRAIQALPPPPGPPRVLDLLLDGLALLGTDVRAAAIPILQRAANAHTDMRVEDVLRWASVSSEANAAVWDYEGMLAISERQVQLVRDAGALALLPSYLSALGIATAWIGDFARTAAVIAEADGLAAAIGSATAPFTQMRLRSLQGREAEASALIAQAIEHAAAGGQGLAATLAHWAAAVMYNGLGQYEGALSAARQATSDTFEPWIFMWALPELVEAAVRGGDTELAHRALTRLAETTQPCGTDWALGVEARCRALLSDGAAADALYREAIDRLGRTRVRPELSRAHLLYGEWLRHQSRRVDAREQLRTAYDMLTAIGMEAFAERAHRELIAAGETVRRRTGEPITTLTAQEALIAGLAGDGLTNPEIGARLFLSARTVQYHLGKIFTKLGIASRRDLPATLAHLGQDGEPA